MNRARFGLFCKSFHRDVSRAEKLVASIERFARDEPACVLSVPERDLRLFRDRIGTGRVKLVTDEEILGKRVGQNWRTQQVVKLHAHRLGFADAWLVLDSDMAFIRDFSAADFVDPDGTVAMVASRLLHLFDRHEKELGEYVSGKRELDTLSTEEARRLSTGTRPHGLPFLRRLRNAVWPAPVVSRLRYIREALPRSGPELNFLPAAVWTRDSLESLERDFLDPHGLGHEDLIRYSPWEGTWVGEWELHRRLPGRRPAESFFLHFASDDAIERARSAGFTTADFASRYVGLQLAAGHQSIESY